MYFYHSPSSFCYSQCIISVLLRFSTLFLLRPYNDQYAFVEFAEPLLFQPGNDQYAFVEFAEHKGAQSALAAMNKRMCMGRVSKVIWVAFQ